MTQEHTQPASGDWARQAAMLKKDGWWLADLCGLDRLGIGGKDRFEVVVQLINPSLKERRTLHVAATGETPAVPSVTGVWPGANYMEREAFDLFGIRFEGHPNLTRILLPDEWEGHPLRKDYGVGKVPVEFLPQPLLQVDSPGQAPSGQAAGAALDSLGQVRVQQGQGPHESEEK